MGNEPQELTKDNLLGEIPWGPSFCVSLELKVSAYKEVWANVLRISGTDGDCCKPGQRYPAIWTTTHKSGPSKQGLAIVTTRGKSGNYAKIIKGMAKDKWIKIEVSQKENEEVNRHLRLRSRND